MKNTDEHFRMAEKSEYLPSKITKRIKLQSHWIEMEKIKPNSIKDCLKLNSVAGMLDKHQHHEDDIEFE